jgi:SAM-dependent methyltransferase
MKALLDRLLGRRSGTFDMGDLRSLQPVSDSFGQDRGTPIRRYYIQRFFEQQRNRLKGHVLEVGDSRYATMFAERGAKIDVLDPDPACPAATIRGNLLTGEGVPRGCFDAIILTQVLHVLPDMQAAISVAEAALKPGGCILATLPCITQVSRFDMDRWGDYWRVTDRGARALFESSFPVSAVDTSVYGNVLSAITSLTGLAAEELSSKELDFCDPDYQVLVGVVATKPTLPLTSTELQNHA